MHTDGHAYLPSTKKINQLNYNLQMVEILSSGLKHKKQLDKFLSEFTIIGAQIAVHTHTHIHTHILTHTSMHAHACHRHKLPTLNTSTNKFHLQTR